MNTEQMTRPFRVADTPEKLYQAMRTAWDDKNNRLRMPRALFDECIARQDQARVRAAIELYWADTSQPEPEPPRPPWWLWVFSPLIVVVVAHIRLFESMTEALGRFGDSD